MKKGFVVAAAVWLTSLAVIAIGYSIFQPRYFHITWSPSELLDPFKFITAGLPILALGLLFGSLAVARNHEQTARTMVQVSFGILLVLSLTAILSVFGLLIAPADGSPTMPRQGTGNRKLRENHRRGYIWL